MEKEDYNKEIIGYCEDAKNISELSNYPILGSMYEAIEACKLHGATEIYSTLAPEQNTFLYDIIQRADENCIRFKIVPDFNFFINKKMHVDHFNGIPIISLRREPLEKEGNKIRKRIFDVIVSSFVIIFILSWLVPIISIIIRLESKGNIFFIQERSGKNNKVFKCIKFRTMRSSADANSKQATRNDIRVTRVGNFLRRYSIDEFPQFINVFIGEMSIVGPRPHMLKHTDDYSRLIRQYMIRQFLKPGITGWAQVNGLRGETQTLQQMQQRVEHDIWYIENWTLLTDINIILSTIFQLKGNENVF